MTQKHKWSPSVQTPKEKICKRSQNVIAYKIQFLFSGTPIVNILSYPITVPYDIVEQ